MKNPFAKQNHNGVLIGTIAAGTAVAGGLAWLLFTEKGKSVLAGITKVTQEKGKDLLAAFISDKTGVSKSITRPATDAVTN